jgi:hypothetical protein
METQKDSHISKLRKAETIGEAGHSCTQIEATFGNLDFAGEGDQLKAK